MWGGTFGVSGGGFGLIAGVDFNLGGFGTDIFGIWGISGTEFFGISGNSVFGFAVGGGGGGGDFRWFGFYGF